MLILFQCGACTRKRKNDRRNTRAGVTRIRSLVTLACTHVYTYFAQRGGKAVNREKDNAQREGEREREREKFGMRE